ncbi:unnamed protein product, partial [Mesorhabditis belari]|uniref:Hexosyltransferase n=1 Tax=Mesorhabditis belari TaxID=2138241 RepID=A0AAF3J361_9BILA
MLVSQISPEKLLIAIFSWVFPYILLANYLERSLLPFRALCYTQSDLLSYISSAGNVNECIQKYHYPRKADPNCRLNIRPEILHFPKVDENAKKIVVIRTAPNSKDYRDFIRSTWKSHFREIPVVFVVGKRKSLELNEESDEQQDVIQFDFTDSYHSLAYKMVSMYSWILEKLPKVEEILVLNDDTIVNVTAIRQLPSRDPDDLWLLGKVSRGYPRLWMPWLTWHVHGDMYPNLCYPRFVQGSSFVISRGAARALLNNICRFPWIHLDDIHVGVMSSCLGIDLIHFDGFDQHTFDRFVVFHYQYSRNSAGYLKSLWENSELSMNNP